MKGRRKNRLYLSFETIKHAFDVEAGDNLGASVSISDDCTIVGATGADRFAGAAYFYK